MEMTSGMRFIRRGTQFMWRHKLELLPGDVDCTHMDDEAFEREVRDAQGSQQ